MRGKPRAPGLAAKSVRTPRLRAIAMLLLLASLFSSLSATNPEEDLAQRYRNWLDEVDLLISDEERQAFLDLDRNYQKDRFIRQFWQVRDPFQDTPHNEFTELWESRIAEAKRRFDSLDGDRSRMLLLNGPPERIVPLRCPQSILPLEIWSYAGTESLRGEFLLVFVRNASGMADAYRLWSPRQGLGILMRSSAGAATMETDPERAILERCLLGEEIVATLRAAVDWQSIEDRIDVVPRPGFEWVQAFLARTTELPEATETFAASLDFTFPGRLQSRTAVQALIRIDPQQVRAATAGPATSYRFVLDGEVLRQGEHFESFRYRFDLPAEGIGNERIPLVVERHLRPGTYTFITKIEDRNAHRFFRQEVELEVPLFEIAAEPKPSAAEALSERLEEANRSLVAREHTIEILALPRKLHTGRLRVEAVASGDRVARVQFMLGKKPLMSKRRPPYSVELDIGPAPQIHQLAAIAVDATGKELARDEVLINAGPYRFDVRLIEPQPGRTYVNSLRARAEVQVPSAERLDRVEFYLGKTLIATLYQPPFVQPILLTGSSDLTYVRAVAYLDDGVATEDLVIVNGPQNLERIQVDLVELYTTVLDRRGRPVEGLEAKDFKIEEDNAEQQIRRFEKVADLQLHSAVLLDVSISMEDKIRDVERAATQFFDNVIGPQDRAALIVFNDEPSLIVPFTRSSEALAGGLADLLAEGRTALYDSVIFALYQFGGIREKRALVLLSDGGDTRSRATYEQALEFARHAGVAIYPIALDLPSKDLLPRSHLQGLADATGGRCFFVDGTEDLDRVYREIEAELRSQYLIAYQSPREAGEAFRQVEIVMENPGHEAKTIPGYYP